MPILFGLQRRECGLIAIVSSNYYNGVSVRKIIEILIIQIDGNKA